MSQIASNGHQSILAERPHTLLGYNFPTRQRFSLRDATKLTFSLDHSAQAPQRSAATGGEARNKPNGKGVIVTPKPVDSQIR